MLLFRYLSSVSISALLLGFSFSAYAGEELKGRAEVNWRYGSERSILMTEMWVPIAQDEDSVLYGDLRMMDDDQENREGNLGIGYRKITEVAGYKGVAGVHGWLDRRVTARGSKFHQLALGTEWLGESADILINGYIPLSDEKEHYIPNANPQGAAFTGTGIVIDTDGTILEEPQAGFDIELGWELGSSFDFVRDHTDSFRVYGGGYYFDGDNTESVAGLRARFMADITSDFQIGARFQRDDERGSQGFLEATLRFPFGQKKSYRNRGLYARLDDAPERDIDIVTGDIVTDPGDRVAVVNQATGQAQEILHVDNTAAGGGDGSSEMPFNTLAAAEAAASAHTIIYVHKGDGTSAGQNTGIILNDTGQQLIGSGTNFTYDSGRFTTANGASPSSTLLATATTAPVITSGGGNGVDIRADDVTVAGIKIDGASANGLYVGNNSGTTWNSVTLKDITSINNTFNGVFVLAINAGSNINNVIVDNITATGNTQRGVLVQANISSQIDNVSLKNVTTENNIIHGVFVVAQNSAQIGSAYLDNITSHNNTLVGVRVGSDGASSNINNVVVDNITTNNNGQNGVYVFTNSGAQIGSAYLDNITSQNNTSHGVWFQANDNSQIDNVSLENITATGNALEGVILQSGNFSNIINVDLDNITANNNVQRGVRILALTGAQIGSASLENITATGNTLNGVFIDDDTTGTFNVDLGGGALGSAGNNSIYGNTGTDLRVDLDGGELKAENNWWGVVTGLDGSEVTLDAGSTVDADPFLIVAP